MALAPVCVTSRSSPQFTRSRSCGNSLTAFKREAATAALSPSVAPASPATFAHGSLFNSMAHNFFEQRSQCPSGPGRKQTQVSAEVELFKSAVETFSLRFRFTNFRSTVLSHRNMPRRSESSAANDRPPLAHALAVSPSSSPYRKSRGPSVRKKNKMSDTSLNCRVEESSS